MHRPDVKPGERGAESTGYHHLAFHIDSRQEVDDLTEKLRQAGCPVVSGPHTGYYESCVLDDEQNRIEITA